MADKLIKIAICWITSAAALYLGGALSAANFDVSTWDDIGRAMLAVSWVAFAAAAVPAILAP